MFTIFVVDDTEYVTNIQGGGSKEQLNHLFNNGAPASPTPLTQRRRNPIPQRAHLSHVVDIHIIYSQSSSPI